MSCKGWSVCSVKLTQYLIGKNSSSSLSSPSSSVISDPSSVVTSVSRFSLSVSKFPSWSSMVVTLIGCHSSFLLFFLLISSFVAFFSSHSLHLNLNSFYMEHRKNPQDNWLISRSRMGHGEALPVAPEVEAAESVGGEGVHLLQAVAEDLVTHAVGSKHHGED